MYIQCRYCHGSTCQAEGCHRTHCRWICLPHFQVGNLHSLIGLKAGIVIQLERRSLVGVILPICISSSPRII